jgi:glycogen debranching enzyme
MSEQKQQTGFWSGTFLGMATGMASLLAYQYFSGILRRPRLISKAVFSEGEAFETKEALAMFIAAENLRSGIQVRFLRHGLSKTILHAGYRNFRESWARDFGFASYGMLAIEQFETVRDTLEAFFWHQTLEGQLPVKLHSMNVLTRFFYSLFGREQPTETPLEPKFVSGHGAPSLDGQAMLVIAALHYAQETEDHAFLSDYWGQFKLGLDWLRRYRKGEDNVLLNQEAYAD